YFDFTSMRRLVAPEWPDLSHRRPRIETGARHLHTGLGHGAEEICSRPESDMRSTLLAATVIVCALICILPTSAGSLPGGAARGPDPVVTGPRGLMATTPARVVLSPAADWPEFHDNPQLSGYEPNATLSATNASHFGVFWDLDTDASILDSPVIAYDPALGETIAYIGNDAGDVLAVDLASGAVVWSDWLGSPIRSSPLVNNGSVYVGTYSNPTIFRLN